MRFRFLFIALASVIIFCSATAISAPLLEATRLPGYEVQPLKKIFILEDTGAMRLLIIDETSFTTKVKELGGLSLYALEGVKNEIGAIAIETPLVDTDAGKGICADSPTLTTSLYKDQIKKEIHREAECHVWQLETYQGQRLAEFAYFFLGL